MRNMLFLAMFTVFYFLYAGIEVISPNGGELITRGNTYHVRWSSTISDPVKIELFENNLFHSTVVAWTEPDGDYSWFVPWNISGNFKIKISSFPLPNLYNDMSDSEFTLKLGTIDILTPNGGEQLNSGDSLDIQWNDDVADMINIDLYENDTLFTSLKNGTLSDGSEIVVLPEKLISSSQFKIKISSFQYNELYDFSDNYFTVNGVDTLLPPDSIYFSDITMFGFVVNWSPSAFADGYRIDVSNDSLFTDPIAGYDDLNVGNVLSKSISGLDSGSRYYIRLRTYYGEFTSDYSSVIVVNTMVLQPPLAIDATMITFFGFTANWEDTCGAEGFWLDIARDSLFTDYVFHELGLGTEEYYNVSRLDSDTDYYYRLRALYNYNVSDYSNVISVHTMINTVGHSFSETTSLSFSNPADWGDYDNDGDLDVLSGKDIYRNDSGSFTLISSVIPVGGISHWGDFDNDGDLDVLLNNKLYRNDNNNFSYYTNFDFYSQCSYYVVSSTCLTDFVDVNSDGYLDIFLTGEYQFAPDYPEDTSFTVTGTITYIYYNNGGSGFKESPPKSFSGSMYQNFTWGDYDNDGDPDLIVTGEKYGYGKWDIDFEPSTCIYRNDSDNDFTSLSNSFPDIINGSTDWGDFDNDGYLDIVLCGDTSSGSVLQIYRNNKDGTFTDIGTGFTGFKNSSAEWGDFDNDGYLDVLVKGVCNSQNATKVFRNDEGAFSLFVDAFSYSSATGCSWADYDNDGDLDLITGSILYNNVTDSAKVNLTKSANTLPTAPTGISSSVNSASVSFTWNKSTDVETPQNGLSYNVYIGTSSMIGDELSPMSDTVNGYRRIVKVGNAGQSFSKTLRSLPNGTYYWSVQAIDNGYAGSEFGTEQSFIINVPTPPPPVAYTASLITTTSFRANWVSSSGATGYYLSVSKDSLFSNYVGVYNNKDVGNVLNYSITGLNNNSVYYFKVKSYNTAGISDYSNVKSVLTNELQPPLVQTASVIKDNSFTANWSSASETTGYYLDVAKDSLFTQYVTGFQNKNVGNYLYSIVTGLTPDTYYYYRLRSYNSGGTSGNGSIMPVLTEFSDILANTSGSLARADLNNDGFMDFVVIDSQSRIYMNNGDGTFTSVDAGLPNLNSPSVDTGDYDNDGNIDILLEGSTGSYPNIQFYIKLFRNNGDGTYSDLVTTLPNSGASCIRWIDYNNDGKSDVMIGSSSTKIFRNEGDGVFTDINATLPSYNWSNISECFDYNNDEYMDLIISGQDDDYMEGDEKADIYENNGDGTFTKISSGIAGIAASSVSTGDFNNDGYLDILITGTRDAYIQDSDDNYAMHALTYTELYRNNGNRTFTAVSNTIIDVSGSGIFADYDNDGLLDIIVSGTHTQVGGGYYIKYTRETKVYKNIGNGTFTDLQADYLDDHSGKITVCDNDNNSKPDLIFSGYDGTGYFTKVYEYDVTTTNTPPVAPSNLSAIQPADNSLTFSWDKATDTETPQNGLSYNLYIGTENMTGNTFSPMSDISTGYRRTVSLGNAQQNTSWTIKDLAPGSYYWSVQAIDHSYSGSLFAPEQTVIVTGIEENIPLTTELYQNYPNPFNPATEIKFSLADDAKINLSVYNTNGQLVRTLLDGKTEKGYHSFNFEASELNSGMYLYRLDVNGNVQTKKMIMLK